MIPTRMILFLSVLLFASPAQPDDRIPDYRPVPGWLHLPDDIQLGPVSAVATDAADRVHVFHRGKHPILVFDRDARFLRSWGDDLVKTAPGLGVDHPTNVSVTAMSNHRGRKSAATGQLVLPLGN